MGSDGQVKQRLTYCHKTASRVWERIYYGSAWGDWFCVSDFDGQLLWSGGYYMTEGHTANLAEPISKQPTGIELIFSPYVDGEARHMNYQHRFVSKRSIAAIGEGAGHDFIFANATMGHAGAKYLTIYDDRIVGTSWNDDSGTGESGIVYDNKYWVLRYVIGV